jgi:hypothetical protein
MRPVAELEDYLNDLHRFDDPNPTTLLRNAKEIDGTETFFLELDYTIEQESHIVLPIDGDTGEGKSFSARKIVSMLRRLEWSLKGINIKPLMTWAPVQTVAKVRKGVLKDWQTIYQDEHRKRGAGKGAATNDWALKNIEHTLRANKNSIIICSPEEHSHQHHAALKARGYDEITGINTLLLRGPEFNLPMAYIYLDNEGWPLDPVVEEGYNDAKREYNEMVKKYGGTPPEVDPDVIELAEEEMLDHLEKYHKEDMFDLSRVELEKIYAYDLCLFSGYYMNDVLTTVLSHLKKMKRRQDRVRFIEEQERLEEHEKEQEALIDMIAPKIVRYFLQYTPDMDKLPFPAVGACKDYLSSYTSLDPKHVSRCIDRTRHLWIKMKASASYVDEGIKEVTAPPPIAAADFSTERSFWIDYVYKRNPELTMEKYREAYAKYHEGDVDYRSHSVAAKTLGVVKKTLQEQFDRIDGAIKNAMGYEFERTIATLYDKSGNVLWMDPKTPDLISPKGKPDRVMILADGSFRVCSWKCHNENDSIPIFNSPESKMAKYLLSSQDKPVVLVLEGLFEGRFFSIRLDSHSKQKFAKINDSDYSSWPPNFDELLRLSNNADFSKASSIDEQSSPLIDISEEKCQ